MDTSSYALHRAPVRLAIVALLSFLVAGACYAVSLTPASQMMAGSRGGPPGGRGGASVAMQQPASVPAPSDATRGTTANATSSGHGGSVAPQGAPMGRRPGGGGRPASLQRGLPELARNLGVIAVLIAIVAGIQFWLRHRRRPQSRRAAA
jgi:hypothetical protein